MTHEFKELVREFQKAKLSGIRSVMATLVALDGSSYRRPGVRMLITETGEMHGAVSGGCVEKEILKQSGSVFRTGHSKVITYDGRYRLGCEGLLYILIEPFDPEPNFILSLEDVLKQRKPFEISSYYSINADHKQALGSVISFSDKKQYTFTGTTNLKELRENSFTEIFIQKMKPDFKLIIIGAEHDAKHLSLFASLLGWEVLVVAGPSDPQRKEDFQGANELVHIDPESFESEWIDDLTSVVLMTHSYVRDLQYLLSLAATKPAYIGLLGPSNRRERILGELIERNPDVEDLFFERIYGPAGLNIGAVSPEEISLSICSEILSVIRKQHPKYLKNKTGAILSGIPL